MNALTRVIGPIVILVCAGLLAFWPSRSSTIILGSANLAAGATRTVQFIAPYSGQYLIGVMFDQQAAKALFPCTADPMKLGHSCQGTKLAPWPVELSLTAKHHGKVWPLTLHPETSTAGGKYMGREVFIRPFAYTSLISGQRYELTVRSLAHWESVSTAAPRVVVQVSSPGFGDQRALIWPLRTGAALGLGVVGIAWLFLAVLAHFRRMKPSGPSVR